MKNIYAALLSGVNIHTTGLSVSVIVSKKSKRSQTGALLLFVHALNSAGLGVSQCLRIVLAATVIPTMIKELST